MEFVKKLVEKGKDPESPDFTFWEVTIEADSEEDAAEIVSHIKNIELIWLRPKTK
jgi:hypothetical protein